MATFAIHQCADHVAQCCKRQVDLDALLQPVTCKQAPQQVQNVPRSPTEDSPVNAAKLQQTRSPGRGSQCMLVNACECTLAPLAGPLAASRNQHSIPVAPVLLWRSLPARSTRLSLPTRMCPAVSAAAVHPTLTAAQQSIPNCYKP